MKQYAYQAQCQGGTAISGTLEAADSDAAMTQLLAMSLENIDVQETKPPRKPRPIGRDDFVFFNEQLASLAGTGLCLDAGLRQLGKDIQSPRLRRVLDDVATDIERGLPLDQALERHAGEMPALYGRVVRAGIESGQLPATLFNLSHHLRLIAETRRLVVEALAYPAIVLVLALGVVCAVMILVVPQFGEIFADFGAQLPLLTVGLVHLAGLVPQLLGGLAVLLLILIGTWCVLRFSSSGRRLRERLLLAIPLLGSVIRDSLRARFLRAASFSVNSGMPLPEAMRLAADATASPSASRDARQIAERVEQGESVYAACREAVLIPPMFGYVVEVNTDRNNLEEGLIQLSGAYESRATHGQSLLRGWLAPLAVIGVGVVIGLCILALFLPFVSLMQSIT